MDETGLEFEKSNSDSEFIFENLSSSKNSRSPNSVSAWAKIDHTLSSQPLDCFYLKKCRKGRWHEYYAREVNKAKGPWWEPPIELMHFLSCFDIQNLRIVSISISIQGYVFLLQKRRWWYYPWIHWSRITSFFTITNFSWRSIFSSLLEELSITGARTSSSRGSRNLDFDLNFENLQVKTLCTSVEYNEIQIFIKPIFRKASEAMNCFGP